MNVIEGLRRIGVVIGAGVFALAVTVATVDDAPTKENRTYEAKNKLMELVWQVQTDEYKAANSIWSMERNSFPDRSAAEIVDEVCKRAKKDPIQAICSGYRAEGVAVLWQWVQHITKAVGIGVLATFAWWLLWAAFMWIVSGFVKPRTS